MDRATGHDHAHNSAHGLEHSRARAAHDGSAVHGEHEVGGRHDKNAGHSVAMFRNNFWPSRRFPDMAYVLISRGIGWLLVVPI